MKRKKTNIEKVIVREVYPKRDGNNENEKIPRLYPTNQMDDGIIPRAQWDEKGNYH